MASDRGTGARVRYRFSPLERRGMIAGWRGGQIAAVAAGLVIGVLSIRSRPSVTGVILAILGLGSGMALAFWPIQGRTGEQWLPLAARWMWTASTGSRRQMAPGPGAGHRATVDPRRHRPDRPDIQAESVGWSGGRGSGGGARRRAGRGAARRAGRRLTVFDGLTVVGVPFGDGSERTAGELGMTIDARARTATAVLVVRGHSFALLGTGDQDGRIAAWARVLSSLAREGSDVHRLQWIETCLPDDGSAVRRHVSEHAVLDADSPAARSYQTLVDEAAPVTRRHQVLMALSIRTVRPLRAARSSGGGIDAIGAVLSREVHSLHRALEGADIVVDGALGPGALSRVIGEASAALADTAPSETRSDAARSDAARSETARSDTALADAASSDAASSGAAVPAGTAPAESGALSRSGAGHAPTGTDRPPHDDRPSHWPWPMAVEPSWDAVHTDGTWHATYWIAEWPRVDVSPDFLAPLLFSPLRRSLSMVMEPMSPSRAARQVAQARTADLADGELRRRSGFLVTARQTREKAGVEERDVELADGHAQFRFSGYVTVTTDSRAELSTARAAVEQAAGQAGIELRLLYGAQDVAFACSLPLARGLS